jgi:hypothetical protein
LAIGGRISGIVTKRSGINDQESKYLFQYKKKHPANRLFAFVSLKYFSRVSLAREQEGGKQAKGRIPFQKK